MNVGTMVTAVKGVFDKTICGAKGVYNMGKVSSSSKSLSSAVCKATVLTASESPIDDERAEIQ